MPGYTEWLISLKTMWQNVYSKYKPFLNQYAEKCSAGKKMVYGWMDKITKKERENTIYLWSAVYQHRKPLVRDLHAADVRYHLYCWLGVTKIQACWYNHFFYYILVWYKCNRQHRWLDTAILNMNAGPVQVYQTCILVGASLTDMTAG